MNYWARLSPAPGFTVLASTERSQAATLVVPPDERTGGSDNAHLDADQWLYVLAGEGRAAVGDQAVELGPGTVVLIEAGEPHEIHNMGDVPLETLIIYTAAVY